MRRVLRHVVAGVVLGWVVGAGVAAGGRDWVSLGPPGGGTSSLLASPTEPGVVYFGTCRSGVYRSDDSGATFARLARITINGEVEHCVRALQQSAGVMYALVDDYGNTEVLRSDDLGRTWSVRARPERGPLELHAATGNPEHLYAYTAGLASFEPFHLMESVDGGGSWQQVNSTAPDETYALAVDGGDETIVYLGTAANHVLRALFLRGVNGGRHFDLVNEDLDPTTPASADVLRLATVPGQAGAVYALVRQHDSSRLRLLHSEDGGTSWGDLDFPLICPTLAYRTLVGDLVVDPSLSGGAFPGSHGVYAVTPCGAFANDDGPTWRLLLPGSPHGAFVEALSRGGDGTLYAATRADDERPGQLSVSRDRGRTWSARAFPISETDVHDVAVSPSRPDLIFAAAEDGVYRSADHGTTWERGYDARALAVVADPGRPERAFAAYRLRRDDFKSGLLQTTDGGATWTDLPRESLGTDLSPSRIVVALAPSDPDTLYVAAMALVVPFPTATPITRSTDGGRTWTPIPLFVGQDHAALAVDPRTPTTVYLAGSAGVFKTTDGGTTWRLATLGLGDSLRSVHALAIDPSRPEVVYAASGLGVYKTTDGAAHWTGVGLALTDVVAITVDRTAPDVVLAATRDAVFRSSDGGTTWTQVGPGGLTGLTDVEVDPADPEGSLVATIGRGILAYGTECTPGNAATVCDDGDPCTTDRCAGNSCVSTTAACFDGAGCSLRRAIGGTDCPRRRLRAVNALVREAALLTSKAKVRARRGKADAAKRILERARQRLTRARDVLQRDVASGRLTGACAALAGEGLRQRTRRLGAIAEGCF